MKLYKQNKFFKIKNINSSGKYRRVISFAGLKIKLKNKNKLAFWAGKSKKEKEELYYKRLELLKQLKSYRENQKYILTCYLITYNQEHCIARAIESILEQKTKYKYLIKILDDASTDKTFDVCYEYAKKYPDKIELITAKQNYYGALRPALYENIETPYFCRLDGDDYWCHPSKIEDSINFLEENNDYVTYAHDNYNLNVLSGQKKSNIHDSEPNKNVTNEISFDNFFYVHVSARIHRNVIDFKNEYRKLRCRDRILWYLFLSKGKAYYDDRIMSVYSIYPTSEFGSNPNFFKVLQRRLICYKINKFLKYKFDNSFTQQVSDKSLKTMKKLFGKVLGWEFYHFKIFYIETIMYTLQSVFLTFFNSFKLLKVSENTTGYYSSETLKTIEKVKQELKEY